MNKQTNTGRQFLIGRFLKAYSSAYRYKERRGPPMPSFERAALEDRFNERRRRFRARQGRYVVHLQLGLFAALLLVISAFQVNIQPSETRAYMPLKQELVTMEEIVQTLQQVKPPPPPRPPVPVEVPNDVILADEDLNLDATLDIGKPLAELPPPPPAPEEEDEPEEVEPEIFVAVEEMPEIIGGYAKIYEYVKYPEMARQAGLRGLVVVQFVVEPDGTPSHPFVVRSVYKVLDDAAIEAIMQLRFKPGRQRGKPVHVRMAIPIRFELRA